MYHPETCTKNKKTTGTRVGKKNPTHKTCKKPTLKKSKKPSQSGLYEEKNPLFYCIILF